MKIWGNIVDAIRGWRLILRDDVQWREQFSLTGAGCGTAVAIFAFVAFLAVAFASFSIGMPNVIGVLIAMLVLALPIFALLLALVITRALIRSSVPALPVMVPGIYAMTAFVVVEAALAMIGGPIVMLSWFVVGYLLFKLVRQANGWGVGVSAGFATLTVLLLVVMRIALYMATNPAGSPI